MNHLPKTKPPQYFHLPAKRSDKRRVDTTINDIARWAGLPADVTRNEIDKYVTRKKIQVYDTYIIINSITDMKRLASSSQITRE